MTVDAFGVVNDTGSTVTTESTDLGLSDDAERRARTALNERELQQVEQSDLTAVEALADIGIDVDEFRADEGLYWALENIRRAGRIDTQSGENQ